MSDTGDKTDFNHHCHHVTSKEEKSNIKDDKKDNIKEKTSWKEGIQIKEE